MRAHGERRRRAGGGPAAARALRLVLVAAAVLVLVPVPAGAQASEIQGMDLTTPVLQNLRRLQTAWQRWTAAFQRSDRNAADAALEEMLANAQHLGMPRLPDLSVAAALHAARVARDGDTERAEWALEAAEDLDAERPETELARAAVARAAGDYVGAFRATARGYLRILRLPVEGQVVRHDAFLWAIFSIGLAGALFLALQMATKGPALLHDLRRFLPPTLSPLLAGALLGVVLLWPLVLPSGILWLLLFWSVLLWSYGSLSERVVIGALWAFVAAIPVGLAVHQRQVELTFSPPTRALANVAGGRLSGTLFTDLGVLHTVVPDHLAVKELIADLHRRFGQWEYARSIYTDLQEQTGQSPRNVATALLNLGVYHHRKGDFATAINFFRAASDADRGFAAAPFDLAQAYSQAYKFTESHQALAQAREVDGAQVNAWIDRLSAEPAESAVAVDGGLDRIPEIRAALLASFSGSERPTSAFEAGRRYLSIFAAGAAAALAVGFGFLRRGLRRDAAGPPPPPPDPPGRLGRTLVPGLFSAVEGHGGRGFAAVWGVAALVLVPLMGSVGYRVPIGFHPWWAVLATASALALLVLFAVRYALARG